MLIPTLPNGMDGFPIGRVGINIRSQNQVKKGLNSCEGHFKLFPIICQLVFQTSIHKQPSQYMQYNKIVCFRKSTLQKKIEGIPSRSPWVCILQIQQTSLGSQHLVKNGDFHPPSIFHLVLGPFRLNSCISPHTSESQFLF